MTVIVCFVFHFIPQTNNITHIAAGSLPPGMKELYLLENPLLVIDDTAFDASATSLQVMYLSEARFTRIPDAFLHLKTLKLLTIYDTLILDWNEPALRAISPNLQTLVLENVGLKTWPGWMTYFTNLTELGFNGNSLSSIPDDAFDKLADGLLVLSLFNNRLTAVPKAVSSLKALRSLNLQGNNIRNVTWLPQSAKLLSLFLFNNSLRDAYELSNSLRNYGDSLTEIDLHGNQLTALPNVSFLAKIEGLDFSSNQMSQSNTGSVPPTINTIDLSHNSLTYIPLFLKTLRNIFEMLLSYNAITRITDADFSKTITGVDLRYNLISELKDNSFPADSIIATLQLNGNPIVAISSLALSTLPQLMELNLQATKLTRLPLALASLTGVRFVDFTNNPGLVCTCLEKGLGAWVATFPRGTILGDCGQTSIYDFFSLLSPLCPV